MTYTVGGEIELGLVGIIKTVVQEELVDTEVTKGLAGTV